MSCIVFIIAGGVIGFFLGRIFRKQKYEEHIGEQIVNQAIKKSLTISGYHLLKNITLPFDDGTTQIDHVLVSKKGVFIIETKHYSGWIFGNQRSKRWMQTTQFGSKNHFQNPLLQNKKHIKVLKELFPKLQSDCFKSVIVFSGDGQFKSEMPRNVFHVDSLADYISSFDDDIITEAQCCWIIGRIEFCRKEESFETDNEHIEYVSRKLNQRAS